MLLDKYTISPIFKAFIEQELLPELQIPPTIFWQGLVDIIAEFSPKNQALLDTRIDLQAKITTYHQNNTASNWDVNHYNQFLQTIGYIEPTGEDFTIETTNVDDEISTLAGPQLVVPVNNARFALNAANARWGSLYDALYGTDVISNDNDCAAGKSYNPKRGQAVIDYTADFLDAAIPLVNASHKQVTSYQLTDNNDQMQLTILLDNGQQANLQQADKFIGYRCENDKKYLLLFKNNGLHIELYIDPDNIVAQSSKASISDVILESALTTIQDCEDSVAAVDAEDKVAVYRNWLGLMKGTLSASLSKGGKKITRSLNADRQYLACDGSSLSLPGRSLMLVRNVGHLMKNNLIVDEQGQGVFEGIVDAVVTTACALYDLRNLSKHSNSRSGSVYIVKPKMHGSQEVAFTNSLFNAVEDMFSLARNTLKVGVMDEERRTTVNLEECIRQVKNRLVFINTGFLDRTGDEIHTSMDIGTMLIKDEIKTQPWISAYENRNVDIGIKCGLPGRAQIGKGMWAKPDDMAEMVATKQGHPQSGASCAWVPSPTAATLHAMHYHKVLVADIQQQLANRASAALNDILTPPFGDCSHLSTQAIEDELANNIQGILGYVVRWIDQGIGCSKVPDFNDVGLMEDRATLRISSQHIANWLHHGVCSAQQVNMLLEKMAVVVDKQNENDPAYTKMAPAFTGIAYQAAQDLALLGAKQPNGYTEPLLHAYRLQKKKLIK